MKPEIFRGDALTVLYSEFLILIHIRQYVKHQNITALQNKSTSSKIHFHILSSVTKTMLRPHNPLLLLILGGSDSTTPFHHPSPSTLSKAVLVLLTFCSFNSFAQNTTPLTHPVLTYQQSHFDADTCCWRQLSAEKKYRAAADLIVAYLNTKNATNKHALRWHAGQMFAMANESALAKKYFKRTYSIFYKWLGDEDDKTWYYYARGTVAFIDGDKNKLAAILRHWERHFPKDKNYQALVYLNENWDKGYANALTAASKNR